MGDEFEVKCKSCGHDCDRIIAATEPGICTRCEIDQLQAELAELRELQATVNGDGGHASVKAAIGRAERFHKRIAELERERDALSRLAVERRKDRIAIQERLDITDPLLSRSLDMLLELEWSVHSMSLGASYCPCCGAAHDQGHASTCLLALLIRDLELAVGGKPVADGLQAKLDEADRLLRELEWAGATLDGFDSLTAACPCCDNTKKEGHTKSPHIDPCKLALYLAGQPESKPSHEERALGEFDVVIE